MINRFVFVVDHLTKARENWLVFVLGVLSVLAMPPFCMVPVLFITIPVFLMVLDKVLTGRRAFFLGWLFSFGNFVAGFYWIAAALFVDIANNWWALPLSIAGLPAFLALYLGGAVLIWQRLGWHGAARVLALMALWGFAEYLRGTVFTGFPWNLWGNMWVGWPIMLQSASLIGAYGLGLLSFFLVTLPYFWMRRFRSRKIVTAIVTGIFVILAIWGAARLSHYPLASDKGPVIRLVQPNIKQTAKWDEALRLKHESDLWELSVRKRDLAPTIIVWPETALSLFSTADVRRLEDNLREKLPAGAILATGVLDLGVNDRGEQQFFNRLSVYDASGARLAAYDKSHLVPFGEYLPLQKYWPVKPVAFRGGQFSAGAGRKTIMLTNKPLFSPLICYEVIFPHEVVDDNPRPQWIVNVTNDAWYGTTTGPYQHLAMAQMRAVEEGLPLVRVANTGVSALIDATGIIRDQLDLNTKGVLDRHLPAYFPSTLYARWGNGPFFVLLILLFGAGFGLNRLNMRPTSRLY